MKGRMYGRAGGVVPFKGDQNVIPADGRGEERKVGTMQIGIGTGTKQLIAL